jgi:hypothetical protein
VRRHAAPAPAQGEDALGLGAAARAVLARDVGQAQVDRLEFAGAAVELDLDAVRLLGEAVDLAARVAAFGDRLGERLARGGQLGLGAGVGLGAGGEQLRRLQAEQALAQRGEAGARGVELRAQGLELLVEAADLVLQRGDARLAGELAEVELLRPAEVAGAAALAVVAVAGDPLLLARQTRARPRRRRRGGCG